MDADPIGAAKVQRNRRRVMEELGREVEMRVKHEEKDAVMDDTSAPAGNAASSSSSAAATPGQSVAAGVTVIGNQVDNRDDDVMGGGDGAAKRRRLLVVTEEQRMAMMMKPDAHGQKIFWDDLTGEELDPAAVERGELEELDFIRKSGLYTKVDRSEAAGARVIGVRWVRTNKGTEDKPNVRCRLVATEVKRYEDESLFAATPPLEALKILIGMEAARGWGITHVDVR